MAREEQYDFCGRKVWNAYLNISAPIFYVVNDVADV